MSDEQVYRETAKGKMLSYLRQPIYLLLSLYVMLVIISKSHAPDYRVMWIICAIYFVTFLCGVFRDWLRRRVYWVKTDGDTLQVYDSVKNEIETYSINEMKRISLYFEEIGIRLKSENKEVRIKTGSLENRRELKRWVRALQRKIKQRDRTVRLRVKEKKLRDRFSIHGDLTVQDSIFVGLPDDAFKKIQRYIKCAAGLGMGFLMSFICPLGFIIVTAIGIYMNIRSSSFAGKHRLLFENPLIAFGRTKQELKIMALSDERLAGILQFHCARKIFIIGSFLPLIAMAALFLTLMIVHS